MPGELPADTLSNILSALPLDITYIDRNDIIRYYSDYRIFSRTPDILGTTVQSCHSPATRDEVNQVIAELRSGRKETSEFMVDKNGRKVRISYLPVKDAGGNYEGLIEIGEWMD